MTSYRFAPNLRKRVAGRFFTRVRRELQKAFIEEKASRNLTQAELARQLGTARSTVCRQLAGSENLTLRTLADYAWALDRDIVFEMQKKAKAAGDNYQQAGVASQVPGNTRENLSSALTGSNQYPSNCLQTPSASVA